MPVTPALARSLPVRTVAEMGVCCRSVCRRSAVTTTSCNTIGPELLSDAEATVCAAAVPHTPREPANTVKPNTRIFMSPPCIAGALFLGTCSNNYINYLSSQSSLSIERMSCCETPQWRCGRCAAHSLGVLWGASRARQGPMINNQQVDLWFIEM